MASKKYFVDIDLQSNKVDNLKADTLDITTNLASANPKRIVYYNNDYYYSDGTNWVLMTNVVPDGGTTGQVLAKATNTDYDLEWVDQTGGGGSGIPFAIASGTDTYTATITGVTAYTDGDAYLIRFTNGNTTSATLNINSLGAIPLYRNNDGALIGGDIVNGGEMLCVYNSTSNVFQAIGTAPNTLISYVTNDDTVTLTKGMPVYAFSGTGDRMTVKRASNVGDSTSAQTVGIVLSTSIASNQKGLIMMQGLLDGLSILPTATFADGDAIYLGATAGTITNVKPYAPNHLVYLGVVTTASNGSSGRMYVRVQNGYELDELHNVQAQSPNLKDTLWYDNTVSPSQWKTASINTIQGAASSTADGYLSSTDWSTFNSKQNAITLTTTGTNGVATLIGNTLNIPTYESSLIPKMSGNEIWRGSTFRNSSITVDTAPSITLSITGTATARAVASTSFATRSIRMGMVAATTSVGRYTGLRGSALLWYLTGGFLYSGEFNISDTAFVTGTHNFWGLASSTTDLLIGGVNNDQPSALTNIIAFANDSGDANLQIMHNDASGVVTKTDLGSSFPSNRTAGAAITTIYSCFLYNAPNSSNVIYRIVNKGTGDVAQGTLSTNLPASTVGLNFFGVRTMGTSGGGITNSGQFDVYRLGVYSL